MTDNRGGEEPPDVGELVARLQQQVEQRRRAGEYPEGLEDDLDGHFRRIVAHRAGQSHLERLQALLPELDARMRFSPERIATGSRTPGGTALHRGVGKVVARQTQGVLEQVQEFADGVRQILHAVVAAIAEPGSHVHPDLVEQVDGLLERFVSYERVPDSPLGVAALVRRVEDLEAAEARRRFRPWYARERFADEFRGSREEILDRYRDLAARFEGCAPVVDLGCGRGEFLELLAELGIEATGVEADLTLVDAGRDRGLKVEEGDLVSWLAAALDGSLGGILLVQVVEHLTPQEIVNVVALAAEKLRPGGKMLIETVNPRSLYAHANALFLDPDHSQPVHPAFLGFLVREAGFASVDIEWRGDPPPDARLQSPPDTSAGDQASVERANVERLNALLFGAQDYAILATR